MLPKSFPENFFFQTTAGKKLKMEYPCSVMNYRVHQKYTKRDSKLWWGGLMFFTDYKFDARVLVLMHF